MRPIFLGLIAACCLSLPAFAAEPDGPSELITQKEALRIAVQGKLSQKAPARKAEQLALLDYYSVPDQPLLWVDEKGLNDRAKSAMGEIAKADDYGLRASDYSLPKPDQFNASDAKANDWLADAEIKVSYAVLDYASDARGARLDPQRLSENLDPTLSLPDPSEVLGSIAIRSDPAAYLRSFQPDQPQFEALRQKLLEARGGGKPAAEPAKPDVVIIPDGPVLKFGVVNEQVALLRKRLDAPAEAGVNEQLFDKDLFQAVRRFQLEHGAAPDGLVGSGTRRMLNNQQDAAPRHAGGQALIQALIVNMERWRWLPNDMSSYYVTVNIPEFMVRVVADDKVIHSARVVAGKPDKQTPIFSQDMQEIVFNPYWNVPNSIKMQEIAPYLQQGGGFFGGGWDTSVLARHGLRVRGASGRDIDPDTIDWGRVDIRNYDLYQPPGPDNVLGTVKFLFPNKHDVYMHDTTQKNLFAQSVRAESHGCMRVQNPQELALVLLHHDQGWTQANIDQALYNEDNHIQLKTKIPVYITYFTIKVNDDGSVSTYNDIYGHDARMTAALNGKPIYESPVASDNDVIASQPWSPRSGGARPRQREALDNDFTRALFGF
ncbi:MAG: L,D-transpeptidase family protein [Methyloceanibacter sp.]